MLPDCAIKGLGTKQKSYLHFHNLVQYSHNKSKAEFGLYNNKAYTKIYNSVQNI